MLCSSRSVICVCGVCGVWCAAQTPAMRKAAETAHRFVTDVEQRGVAHAGKGVLASVVSEEKATKIVTELSTAQRTFKQSTDRFVSNAKAEWKRFEQEAQAQAQAAAAKQNHKKH